MMHYEQYVVAITDNKGKSYREFESERLHNGRKSKVYLPFDSEYKILIKNNSERRIKLSIDIDGTSVSSTGLIINAFTTESLERFVDVARKFLFVKKNDERVSDPSSGENGILKVSIEREAVQTLSSLGGWTYQPSVFRSPSVWDGTMPCTYTAQNVSEPTYGAVRSLVSTNDSWTASTLNASCCIRSAAPLTKQLLNEESGATVEGGASNQSIGTTHWYGSEGTSYEFIFKLLGQQGVSDETRIEYEKYLELKKKFGG